MEPRNDACPPLGILCWEGGQVPRALEQLEGLAGNSTNRATYDFPVMMRRVRGANIRTILESPDRSVLETMIGEIRDMVRLGVRAITTSCGFNAIFQEEMARAAGVPVFASSLLQVPLALRISGGRPVAVITAKKGALRREHFAASGIPEGAPVRIFGLEECPQWGRIFTDPEGEVDLEEVRREVAGTALRAVGEVPDLGAFVLECTDLPPFSEEIRRRTGVPVFDFVTLVRHVASTLGIGP